jgi:hypothetical protein
VNYESKHNSAGTHAELSCTASKTASICKQACGRLRKLLTGVRREPGIECIITVWGSLWRKKGLPSPPCVFTKVVEMQRVHSRRSPGNPPADRPTSQARVSRDFSQMRGATRGSRPRKKRKKLFVLCHFHPLQDLHPFMHLLRPKSIEMLSRMHPVTQ